MLYCIIDHGPGSNSSAADRSFSAQVPIRPNRYNTIQYSTIQCNSVIHREAHLSEASNDRLGSIPVHCRMESNIYILLVRLGFLRQAARHEECGVRWRIHPSGTERKGYLIRSLLLSLLPSSSLLYKIRKKLARARPAHVEVFVGTLSPWQKMCSPPSSC
jgi:hypothetical protein